MTKLRSVERTADDDLCARAQNASDVEAFMTGPQPHALEGMVRVTPVELDSDRVTGKFYGEFLWENSWEGQWHRHYYGIHSDPLCWKQVAQPAAESFPAARS